MAVSNVNNTPAKAATGSAASATGTTAAEQQDRFMKLLVAQMQNQDPLNPMDNAQMTSQIAQINTVSGIEKLNSTVETLLGGFYALQAQSATQLPGKTVLVDGTALNLDAGGAIGGVTLGGDADTVSVDILDAGGNKVQTLSLGKTSAGPRTFGWDGLRADGQAAEPGAYKMKVTATLAGKEVKATTLSAAQVIAVSSGSNGLQVDLGRAGVKPYGDIKSFL